MKPSYRLGVVGLVIAVAGPGPAQPPAAEPPIIVGPTGAPPGPATPPLALLLDDFRVVDGDVRKTPDGYEVRRGKAVEKIAAKRVLFAGESLADVQTFLKARAARPAAPQAVPTEAMKFFAARVQPILTNGCANCHARADHAGPFRLIRVPEGFAGPEATQRNAAAAAAFLDPTDRPNSPLLVKAITAHGGQRTPSLHGRAHPAFRNLELWAQQAAPAAAKAPAPMPAAKAEVPVTTPTAPANDPFDPEPFNRTVRRDPRH